MRRLIRTYVRFFEGDAKEVAEKINAFFDGESVYTGAALKTSFVIYSVTPFQNGILLIYGWKSDN